MMRTDGPEVTTRFWQGLTNPTLRSVARQSALDQQFLDAIKSKDKNEVRLKTAPQKEVETLANQYLKELPSDPPADGAEDPEDDPYRDERTRYVSYSGNKSIQEAHFKLGNVNRFTMLKVLYLSGETERAEKFLKSSKKTDSLSTSLGEFVFHQSGIERALDCLSELDASEQSRQSVLETIYESIAFEYDSAPDADAPHGQKTTAELMVWFFERLAQRGMELTIDDEDPYFAIDRISWSEQQLKRLIELCPKSRQWQRMLTMHYAADGQVDKAIQRIKSEIDWYRSQQDEDLSKRADSYFYYSLCEVENEAKLMKLIQEVGGHERESNIRQYLAREYAQQGDLANAKRLLKTFDPSTRIEETLSLLDYRPASDK